MFREQEHRQERIGVGMTLWPAKPTRGEEANEIEIGNLHESGGRRILVSTLLAVIDRMLAPDFYVQSPDRKHTRQEFIDSMPSLKITRFDASVLTVEPRGNDWSVLIFEKVEVETKDKDGITSKGYRVLVARDGWRKLNDNQWTLLSSEPLSQQRWQETPPIANW
jgi:hypothetical protein